MKGFINGLLLSAVIAGSFYFGLVIKNGEDFVLGVKKTPNFDNFYLEMDKSNGNVIQKVIGNLATNLIISNQMNFVILAKMNGKYEYLKQVK